MREIEIHDYARQLLEAHGAQAIAEAAQNAIDLEVKGEVELARTWRHTARQNGMTATFMPKPLFEDSASGMHVHQSLWKGETKPTPCRAQQLASTIAVLHVGGVDHDV